jgi:hypothetical protein
MAVYVQHVAMHLAHLYLPGNATAVNHLGKVDYITRRGYPKSNFALSWHDYG